LCPHDAPKSVEVNNVIVARAVGAEAPAYTNIVAPSAGVVILVTLATIPVQCGVTGDANVFERVIGEKVFPPSLLVASYRMWRALGAVGLFMFRALMYRHGPVAPFVHGTSVAMDSRLPVTPYPPTVQLLPWFEESKVDEALVTDGMTRLPLLSWIPCPTVGARALPPVMMIGAGADHVLPPSTEVISRMDFTAMNNRIVEAPLFTSRTTEK
jgi:hypothetical protein